MTVIEHFRKPLFAIWRQCYKCIDLFVSRLTLCQTYLINSDVHMSLSCHAINFFHKFIVGAAFADLTYCGRKALIST